jgi:hypothetical protein
MNRFALAAILSASLVLGLGATAEAGHGHHGGGYHCHPQYGGRTAYYGGYGGGYGSYGGYGGYGGYYAPSHYHAYPSRSSFYYQRPGFGLYFGY